MNTLQRWLIVIAVWIFAIGVFLHAFTGRYRLPILDDDYVRGSEHSMTFWEARYDTWTGKLEVTQLKPEINILGKMTGELKRRWEETPSSWIKDLK